MIKKIKTIIKDSFYFMDPRRIALPSSGTNTDMLLYAPQARVRVDYKIEKAFCKGLS